jgi:glycosyltransferase involved in cell wall biosynthesis
MTVSVIVAASGRPTLPAAVASVAAQLRAGDELLVDVNDDAPWGHAARNRLMLRARGDWLAFLDDDDEWAPDVRKHLDNLEPARIHIFRMEYPNGARIWDGPVLRVGNVSTQMIAVPNNLSVLGRWGDRYEGDWDFISSTQARLHHDPAWHEQTIALVRPER